MGLFWIFMTVFALSMLTLLILPRKKKVFYACVLTPLICLMLTLVIALSWQSIVIDDGVSVFSVKINEQTTTIYYDASEDSYFYLKAAKGIFEPQYVRVYADPTKAIEFKEHYDALQTINMFE